MASAPTHRGGSSIHARRAGCTLFVSRRSAENPRARIERTERGIVPLASVLDTGLFDPELAAEAPGWDEEIANGHAPETEEYGRQHQQVLDEFNARRDDAFEELRKKAAARDVALIRTPMGLALAPMRNGEVVDSDAFQHLPVSYLHALRAGGQITDHRDPFDRVLALEQEAQARWREEELKLQAKVEDTQRRLSELESSKDKSQKFVLSPEQQREIAQFRKDMFDTKIGRAHV